MKILMINGHPAAPSLSGRLLELYDQALPPETERRQIVLAQIDFDPILHNGYAVPQMWEDDLAELAKAIDWCDHLVIAFPMWWGSMPALLKGMFDRLFLPHFAFRYHNDDPWWDRLLAGRSADVLITMDTPPWYLRLAFGNAIVWQIKRQILGFCGFKPVRVLNLGPVKKGGAAKALARWQRQIAKLAHSAPTLRRAERQSELSAFVAYRQEGVSS